MQFPTDTNNDIYGDPLTWLKTTNAPNRFYTNGFALTGPVIGSTQVTPRPLGWTTGSIELGEGNLTLPRTNQVTVGSRNRLSINSANQVKLSVTSSGSLGGRFTHPETGQSISLKGVYLQKPQFGAGFFLGTNESGFFILQANP